MADTSNTYLINFLSKIPLFSGLDEQYIKYFLKYANIKLYDKGNILFSHGDPVDTFHIILDGWVKLFRYTEDGNEAVIAICTKNDSFSKAILFDEGKHPSSAEAIENTTIFEIPAHIIRDKIKTDTKLAYNMITSMANSINLLGMQIEHLASMKTDQRVGCFLLKLCESQNTTTECKLPYDKTIVARYLGMKAETFSRTLNKLKKIGVTIENNNVTISNLIKLKEYCCIACSSTEECSAAKKACCLHNCTSGQNNI